MRPTILDTTDWDALEHAYGPATDAPGVLADLLSADPERCGQALGWLDAAALHQGSIYSVTAPVARVVAAALDDPRTDLPCSSALPWDDRVRPLRVALLEWLGEVAESAAWGEVDDEGDEGDEAWDEGEPPQAVAACRAARAELFTAVAPFLDHDDPAVRQAATGAACALLLDPDLADRRPGLAERLLGSVATAPPAERAGVALTLGRWDVAPSSLLHDPHPGVRACAALVRPHDDAPDATAEVRRALRDPRAADTWLPQPPPRLDGQLRFALLAALLRRTTTFEEVVDEAVAVAAMTSAWTVEQDWGPLLVRAFPARSGVDGVRTPAQRRFVTTLVANDACWGGIANPVLWLRRAGLPSDREALRALVAAAG